LFGWIAIWNLGLSVVAVDNAMASQCLMPLFNMAPSEVVARVITVVLLVIQAVIIIASTRIVGWTNSLAVGVELAIVVVLGIALIVAVVLTGHGSTHNLFSQGIAAGAPNYFSLGGGLMAALIMGLSTLVGFDASANMAEEAKDPFRSVPRAIVGSVVAAAVLGFFFVIVLTIAITDMVRVSTSNSPVAEIMRDQFGPGLERPFLLVIAVAFFGAGLVTMAAASRIIFAMSRDGRFPAHGLFKRVNPRTQTPIPATLLLLVLGIVLMVVMPGGILLQLILAGAILTSIPYAMTIVLYLVVRRKLEKKEGAFSLGRFRVAGRRRRSGVGSCRTVRGDRVLGDDRPDIDRRRPDDRGRSVFRLPDEVSAARTRARAWSGRRHLVEPCKDLTARHPFSGWWAVRYQ
jgi:amino acid transporter